MPRCFEYEWLTAYWLSGSPAHTIVLLNKRRSCVKLLTSVLMGGILACPMSAQADWRWAKPHFKIQKVKPVCESVSCHRVARIRARENHTARIEYYNARKLAEWKNWTRLYIPDCTWYGESGIGPEFAKYRYTLPNATGSGAYGKYQFMIGTYHNVAKYHDWSPLDQEIAAHREYWARGITPWSNC